MHEWMCLRGCEQNVCTFGHIYPVEKSFLEEMTHVVSGTSLLYTGLKASLVCGSGLFDVF